MGSIDPEVRQYAAGALGEIGSGAAALIHALQDPDIGVRYYTVEALKSIGTPEALNAVKEYEKLRQ